MNEQNVWKVGDLCLCWGEAQSQFTIIKIEDGRAWLKLGGFDHGWEPLEKLHKEDMVKEQDKKSKALDYYTILDRVSIVQATWDKYIDGNETVSNSDKLRILSTNISELIAEFYQEVGVKWDKAEAEHGKI